MATFNIEIAIDNAAFEDSGELARILRKASDQIEVQVIDGQVTHNATMAKAWRFMDINGNQVGTAWIEED